MRNSIIVVVLIIIGLLGWLGYQNFLKPKSPENQTITTAKEGTAAKTLLTPEIEASLVKKIQLLENFAKQSNIVSAVEAQNVKNVGLTQSTIKELDNKWI